MRERTRRWYIVSRFSSEGGITTSFLVLLAGCMLRSKYAVTFYWVELVVCEGAGSNGVLSGLFSPFLTRYLFAVQTCVRDCSGKALFRLPLFNFLVPYPLLCVPSSGSSFFFLSDSQVGVRWVIIGVLCNRYVYCSNSPCVHRAHIYWDATPAGRSFIPTLRVMPTSNLPRICHSEQVPKTARCRWVSDPRHSSVSSHLPSSAFPPAFLHFKEERISE